LDQGTACGHSDLVELGVPSLAGVEGDAGVGAGAGAYGAGVGADIDLLMTGVACVVAYVLTAPRRSGTNAVVDAGSVLLSGPDGEMEFLEVGMYDQGMGAANVVGAAALRQRLAFQPLSQPLYGVE